MQAMDTTAAIVDETSRVEALYRADAGRLWRAVYAYAGDPDIATDAVAEAYAQVLHRGSAVRDPAAWTWRTAFRVGDARPETSEAHVDRYADPDLFAALRKLPDGQRGAVVLYYYADLPVRQIADRLGSNSLAVRANLSRGRRRLRELLGERDG